MFYDSMGNELIKGDIVRMYHFTGTRNRRHFMYKRFTGYCTSHKGNQYGTWQSLDEPEHNFVEYDNKFKDIIIIVQRNKFHKETLIKSKTLRD